MSTKFYLLSRQAKNGDCPIVVSVCIKGQRLVTSIGYGCNPGNWNKTKMEVRGENGKGIPAKVINLRIYKIKTAFLNYEIACSESAAQIPQMKKMLRTTIHGREPGNQEDKILMNQYMDYGIKTRQWADGTIYNNRMMFRHLILYRRVIAFAKGHRWGFFPSGSAGWRISEEPFFAPARNVVDNLKIRASVGTLGNQNVGNYDYMRTISLNNHFSNYTFDGTGPAQYASISAPNSSSLTWETAYQYNVGLDLAMLGNRLNFTAEAYIRDTKNMLVQGNALPSVYDADAPKENAADLRTKGYELSIGWRDEGQRIGEIWGFVVDGLFQTDEEAKDYQNNVCDALTYIGDNRGGFFSSEVKSLVRPYRGARMFTYN